MLSVRCCSSIRSIYCIRQIYFKRKRSCSKRIQEVLVYLSSQLFCLSKKWHFSPHPHEKIYTFDLKIVEELHSVDETWTSNHITLKEQNPKPSDILVYLFFFFCELSYALHVKYVNRNLSLSEMCKGRLEETLWHFLTSTEQ